MFSPEYPSLITLAASKGFYIITSTLVSIPYYFYDIDIIHADTNHQLRGKRIYLRVPMTGS